MKIPTLILLAISLTACSNRERNCKDYRTGKFEFTKEFDGKKQSSITVRTDSLQIETYQGKTDTATVRWVSDCEFVLRKLHPKTMNEQKAVSITILATDEKGYTFEYSYVGDAKKQRGTVTKLD
ncbi:MAG: hypothetical protein RL427_1072 [Bacteroidota bacterium]|jgi:hypothetical protein